MERVILTGFDGVNNSSRIAVEMADLSCRKLILPNDKLKAAKILLEEIEKTSAVCVVMLGQKPNIADKIAIEPMARGEKDVLKTNLDVTVSAELIKSLGYNAYISKGCGNSYCNHIYYNCLLSGTNCIFLHIPTLSNISDISELVKAIEGYIKVLSGIPAVL